MPCICMYIVHVHMHTIKFHGICKNTHVCRKYLYNLYSMVKLTEHASFALGNMHLFWYLQTKGGSTIFLLAPCCNWKSMETHAATQE